MNMLGTRGLPLHIIEGPHVPDQNLATKFMLGPSIQSLYCPISVESRSIKTYESFVTDFYGS